VTVGIANVIRGKGRSDLFIVREEDDHVAVQGLRGFLGRRKKGQ